MCITSPLTVWLGMCVCVCLFVSCIYSLPSIHYSSPLHPTLHHYTLFKPHTPQSHSYYTPITPPITSPLAPPLFLGCRFLHFQQLQPHSPTTPPNTPPIRSITPPLLPPIHSINAPLHTPPTLRPHYAPFIPRPPISTFKWTWLEKL